MIISPVTVYQTDTTAFPFLRDWIDTIYIIKACNLLQVCQFLTVSHELCNSRDANARQRDILISLLERRRSYGIAWPFERIHVKKSTHFASSHSLNYLVWT